MDTQVYCTNCVRFTYRGDTPDCPCKDRCSLLDCEDSRPLSERPCYVSIPGTDFKVDLAAEDPAALRLAFSILAGFVTKSQLMDCYMCHNTMKNIPIYEDGIVAGCDGNCQVPTYAAEDVVKAFLGEAKLLLERQTPKKPEEDDLTKHIRMQNQYLVNAGGPLGVREADETFNGLNRQIIVDIKEKFGSAFLGKINFDGEKRTKIVNGGKSIYTPYTGQKLYNFCCDFCVPEKDSVLEEMIRRWNTPGVSQDIAEIMDRIKALNGVSFLWY